MNIQKPKALTLKSTADLWAILNGDKPLSSEDAREIAAYAIQCELEDMPPYFRSDGPCPPYYPEHNLSVA